MEVAARYKSAIGHHDRCSDGCRNRAPLDYYVLPRIDIASAELKLSDDNGLALDGYRFDDLEPFLDSLTPVPMTEAA